MAKTSHTVQNIGAAAPADNKTATTERPLLAWPVAPATADATQSTCL